MSFPRYPEYKDSGVEWLGEVPAGWATVRLRFVAATNPSKSEVSSMSADTLVSFLPMEAISEDGTLRLDAHRPISDLAGGYSYFRDGDVAFAKITPCFENGKGALMHGLRGGVGFGTTELTVLRPNTDRVAPRFLMHITRSWHFLGLGEGHMYGAGGQKRVPEDFARNFPAFLPSLPEQHAIVAFLDGETAKIDALVAEQERLIELLAEKRQAVISHAVTKGLNPGVPTKDSGISWLGRVPAHWEVRRAKAVSRFTTSGPRGWSERIGEEGVLFIQSGDLNDALGIEFLSSKRVAAADDAESVRTALRDGDVVVCITGAKTGNVAVASSVPERAHINQHLCLIRPTEAVLPGFLGLLLKGIVGRTHFELSQYGLKQEPAVKTLACARI